MEEANLSQKIAHETLTTPKITRVATSKGDVHVAEIIDLLGYFGLVRGMHCDFFRNYGKFNRLTGIAYKLGEEFTNTAMQNAATNPFDQTYQDAAIAMQVLSEAFHNASIHGVDGELILVRETPTARPREQRFEQEMEAPRFVVKPGENYKSMIEKWREKEYWIGNARMIHKERQSPPMQNSRDRLIY